MDWYQYDREHRHEEVNLQMIVAICLPFTRWLQEHAGATHV